MRQKSAVRGIPRTSRNDLYNPRYNITQPTSTNTPRAILPRPTNTPFIKPLIPGQPGPNTPGQKICRYCKNERHLIDECRKLAYRRSITDNAIPSTSGQNKDTNSGNVMRNPGSTDAPRVANQNERQTATAVVQLYNQTELN